MSLNIPTKWKHFQKVTLPVISEAVTEAAKLLWSSFNLVGFFLKKKNRLYFIKAHYHEAINCIYVILCCKINSKHNIQFFCSVNYWYISFSFFSKLPRINFSVNSSAVEGLYMAMSQKEIPKKVSVGSVMVLKFYEDHVPASSLAFSSC